jgi:U4/U6.U5 tri-snRNP-associated protein 3
MSDNERPRDRYRERDSRREPRGGRGGRRDNRDRSRSPFRRDEGGGDRSDRGRGGGRGRNFPDRDRDRARSPPKGPRGSAAPPSRAAGGPVKPPTGPRSTDIVKKEESPEDVDMKEETQKPEDLDEDTWAMMKTMGFGGFKSTKNTKVPGNDKNYGVRRDKKMEARQYMNRQGGFNRPLSPSRG